MVCGHGVLDGIPGIIDVETPVSFDVRVGDDRDGMVADHAPGLAKTVFIRDEQARLSVALDEGLDETAVHFRIEDFKERMLGPVSVPQGEIGIEITIAAMRFLIPANIVAIHIGDQVGHDEGMVERGIERDPLFVTTPQTLSASETVPSTKLSTRSNGTEKEAQK